MAQLEVEDMDSENQQQKVNQLNATAKNFTNHAFVSFLASIDLFKNAPRSPAKIYTMICSQKSPVQLINVDNFNVAELDDNSVDVQLQLELQQVIAQILCYISKNFTFLIQDPEIKHLTKDEFKMLLKHKFVNITQEDEVIKALCLWLDGQKQTQKKQKNANVPKKSMFQSSNSDGEDSCDLDDSHDPLDPNQLTKEEFERALVADLNDILLNVNWDYVSLPCLLDILRNQPLMRQSSAL